MQISSITSRQSDKLGLPTSPPTQTLTSAVAARQFSFEALSIYFPATHHSFSYPFAAVTLCKHPSDGVQLEWRSLASVREGETQEPRRIFNRICQISGEPSIKPKARRLIFLWCHHQDDDDDVKEDTVVLMAYDEITSYPTSSGWQWKCLTSSASTHCVRTGSINHGWPPPGLEQLQNIIRIRISNLQFIFLVYFMYVLNKISLSLVSFWLFINVLFTILIEKSIQMN